MNQLLKIEQILLTEKTKMECKIKKFLGGGGQGEVYKISVDADEYALKWYFPDYLSTDKSLRERIYKSIDKGPPSKHFLWPIELVESPDTSGFGYIMALREERFKGIVDLMTRRVRTTFRELATVGFHLADSYFQLHARGLCYRDISFGNVFFDPTNGEVRICDNDNVDVNGVPGIIGGTPRFMAPEIVRGEAEPSSYTDLFSLSVLLFYIFFLHHPLEGKKEYKIHSMDLPAMKKLYGTEPIFIFDPQNNSNYPVDGYHQNPLIFWPIYPKFLQDLFIKAFTEGLIDAINGRVAESIWRHNMIRLRDSILYCQNCGSQNFYDIDIIRDTNSSKICWKCNTSVKFPSRMKIGRNIIMLNFDTELFPHHIDDSMLYDFSKPIARISQHPKNKDIWGLKNLSDEKWVVTKSDGSIFDVDLGKSVTLESEIKINFGKAIGEVRI